MERHYLDLTGGVQNQTSKFLQRDNELKKGINVDISNVIGGVTRISGYEQFGSTLRAGKPVRSALSYWRKNGEHKLFGTVNNSGDTLSDLMYESNGSYTALLSDLPADVELESETFMDYAFIVGASDSTFYTTTSILGTTTSTTDNVYGAPKGKYIREWNQRLYIGNCEVDGVSYPSRVYYSSPPMSFITLVNGDQSGNLSYLDVDNTKYLKTGQVIDIYEGGTNNKKIDSLTIGNVNHSLNRIYFNLYAGMNVKDNDDIYLEDKKGQDVICWDTEKDWFDVATDDGEELMGIGINLNRMLFIKRNSVRKFDGAQLTLVTDNIGTISSKSIKQLSTWTIFLHDKGVYGISGNELKLLSKKIEPYIKAITPSDSIVAGIDGEQYKLWIGEPQALREETTTTSTSSTSTSSTSTSTSTSVTTLTTSTSSTSSSISTSTSSTSTSTSSTSTSSTSTSVTTLSTSTSSSTSTTAAPTNADSTRLVYDFSNNAWTIDVMPYLVYSAVTHKMNNVTKLYFGSELGRIYRDNIGTSFAGWPIPLEIETKRWDQDKPQDTKDYQQVHIYSNKGAEGTVAFSVNGEQYISLGQLTGETTVIDLPSEAQGRDISFKVMQSGTESPLTLYGFTLMYKIIGVVK
jgi:hypothetical protein